jgi:tetratricopeptide (TPR) repeat protein
MIERGVTMPSAQSLLTLAVLYHLPVQRLLDLVALERYHARKPAAETDPAHLERQIHEDLRSGRYSEAYARALRCLDLVKDDGSEESRAQAAGTRLLAGVALWKMGWLAQASNGFREIVDELRARPQQRAWAYQNLVEVERQQGRLASARAYARDGLELAESLDDERLIGSFHGTLANLERDLGELEPDGARCRARIRAALVHHERCRALAAASGDRFLFVNDLLNEGVTRALAGQIDEAGDCLGEGLRLADEGGFLRLAAFARLERGKMLLVRREAAAARRELREAERAAAAADAPDLTFLVWFYLLRCALELDDDPSEAWRRCRSLRSLQEGRLPELEELMRLEARQELAT